MFAVECPKVLKKSKTPLFSYQVLDKNDHDCKIAYNEETKSCPPKIDGTPGNDGQPGHRGGDAGKPGRETKIACQTRRRALNGTAP